MSAATSMKDLAALPGNRFAALEVERPGQHSIRMTDAWRISFAWLDGSPGRSDGETVDDC
jgi:proteic killer suppression protein